MTNKEVIEILDNMRKHMFKPNWHYSIGIKQTEALTEAIRCVELVPELVDWCNRLHCIVCLDHCKSDKTRCIECWMQQPIELIKKAKEVSVNDKL